MPANIRLEKPRVQKTVACSRTLSEAAFPWAVTVNRPTAGAYLHGTAMAPLDTAVAVGSAVLDEFAPRCLPHGAIENNVGIAGAKRL